MAWLKATFRDCWLAPAFWEPWLEAMLFAAMMSVIAESKSRRSNCSSNGRRSRRDSTSHLLLPGYHGCRRLSPERHAALQSIRPLITGRPSSLTHRPNPFPTISWHDPPAHDGIERKHAPPVANRGIEILLHGHVVIELSVQVVGEAVCLRCRA